MRIGVDLSPALAEGSGLRRYVELLLDGFSRAAPEDEFFLCASFWDRFPEQVERLRLPGGPRFHLVLKRFPQRVLLPAEQLLGLRLRQRWLNGLGLDLFHGLGNILPPLRGLPTVLTLHHVGGPFDSPSWWDRFYFMTQTRNSVRAADRVIAISDFTRSEILREYGLPPEKVVRVYYGGADPLFDPSSAPEPLEPWGVRPPYVLFVSAINKRKNLEVLVKAFARLKKDDAGRALQLVLAGSKSAYFPRLEALYTELGLSADVRVIENPPQGVLRTLYQKAAVFCYPSKLEGFGLPPLEAMACGTPVVASRATAIPEVVGDAGLLVDPDSVEGFEQALRETLTRPDRVSDLKARGARRVKEFTWDLAARQTLDVYRQLLA